jgi:hypothetical protein
MSDLVKANAGMTEEPTSDDLATEGFDLRNVGHAGVAHCPICFGTHKVTKNTLNGMPMYVIACNGGSRYFKTSPGVGGIRMLGVPAEAVRTGGPALSELFRRQLQTEREAAKLLPAAPEDR